MKNKKTIKRIAIGVIIVLAVCVLGKVAVKGVAQHQLRAALADIPGSHITFKGLRLNLLAGNAELRDVEVELQDTTLMGLDLKGKIEAIRLEKVSWSSLPKGEASAKRLLIKGPQANLLLTGKASGQEENPEQESTPDSPFHKIFLGEVKVENGTIDLKSLVDSTKAFVLGMNLSLGEMGLQLADGQVEYNDSSYRVALDSLVYIDAAGLSRFRISHLKTAEAGPIQITGMHVHNIVPQEELAERMGKVASMWFDARLDSLVTSPVNLPRLIKSQQIAIDNIRMVGSDVILLQDDRYAPPAPYPTLQEQLNAVEMPLTIKEIQANLQTLTFLWMTSDVNRGTFPIHDIKLKINSVSNAPGNVMKMEMHSGSKTASSMDFTLALHNNKAESVNGRMQVYNLKGSQLDSFLRPLFGATVEADLHKIDSQFSGDKTKLTNNFCILYDNLKLKAWGDKTAPFQAVAKNSDLVSFLANITVPNSNPTAPGRKPKTVKVSFDRDPMVPYPAYLVQNITSGMLRTFLPGGNVTPFKSDKKADKKKK